MATKKQKRVFNFDTGLLVLLSLASFSSIFTLRKFSRYQDQVEETMKRNLETIQNEHRRSLDELKSIVTSGLLKPSSASSVVSNSLPSRALSGLSKEPPSVFRPLPSGLSIVRAGDWYLTDGVWKYGNGDMSPVGLITNITCGLVYTDIDVFSYCNAPLSVKEVTKSSGGKFL